ncbi:unnamed protein product [Trypanosoma congolense IL3000]|uniref:WGS project CAEQ00000000 data, annotated contig 250 n=1 Tax=Trypanosoma congolense (strain IL3000) TaxID=1068625 RepID=F9WED3_TRYCI|nr:unnamed protein product [Trypanosoma congolense IL3000]
MVPRCAHRQTLHTTWRSGITQRHIWGLIRRGDLSFAKDQRPAIPNDLEVESSTPQTSMAQCYCCAAWGHHRSACRGPQEVNHGTRRAGASAGGWVVVGIGKSIRTPRRDVCSRTFMYRNVCITTGQGRWIIFFRNPAKNLGKIESTRCPRRRDTRGRNNSPSISPSSILKIHILSNLCVKSGTARPPSFTSCKAFPAGILHEARLTVMWGPPHWGAISYLLKPLFVKKNSVIRQKAANHRPRAFWRNMVQHLKVFFVAALSLRPSFWCPYS